MMLRTLDFIFKEKPNLKYDVAYNIKRFNANLKSQANNINIGKYITNIRKYIPRIQKPILPKKPIQNNITIMKTIIADTTKQEHKKIKKKKLFKKHINKKKKKINNIINNINNINHKNINNNDNIQENEINSIKPLNKINDESKNIDDPFDADTSYQINEYRIRAISAIHHHKIFNVSDGRSSVRNALLKRGWVEKKLQHPLFKNMSSRFLALNAKPGNDYESMFLSRLIGDVPLNFLWGNQSGLPLLINKYRLPYRCGIKRCRHSDFTNKEGLVSCYHQAHWSAVDNISDIEIPRCYRLSIIDDRTAFQDNYRITCCINLIKFISENHSNEFLDKCGKISINVIDFATHRIRNKIMILQHGDLDNNIRGKKLDTESDIKDADWDKFCLHSNQIIKGIEKITLVQNNSIERYITKCKILLHNSTKYWPKIQADGYRNLWILKPGHYSRGIGIEIKDNYDDIIKCADQNTALRYVVQKYIERPLLIYKTKFDIRQFVLITITETYFNIWMYKNCYLRFSSQEFQLNQLNKSIHVTNNSVQRYYMNGKRSDKLPIHNMWTLKEFKTYLACNNKQILWDNKIYPNMKNILIAIIAASIDYTELTPNTFGFYGADFLLDYNFDAHLLEINSSPDMAPTTCVTTAICPQVQEDVIKVVVDLPQNKNADTGDFERIFRVNCEKPPNEYFLGMINGKSMDILKKDPETNQIKKINKTIFKKNLIKMPRTISNNKSKIKKSNIKVISDKEVK